MVSWGLYSPEKIVSYQIDASNIFSPEMYEEHFLKYDRKIIESFPNSIVHIHYAGIHMIQLLLKIEELKAIQINLDREAERDWDIHHLLETCRGIQRKDKCVQLVSELSPDELETRMKHLEYRGLTVFYREPRKETEDIGFVRSIKNRAKNEKNMPNFIICDVFIDTIRRRFRIKRLLSGFLILTLISIPSLFAATGSDNHDVQIDIAEIAAIALTDPTTLLLTTSYPAQAGDVRQGDTDSLRYLQYATLNNTGFTRKIQCSLDVSEPAGVDLLLTLSGGLGSSAGQVTLTTTDQDMVTAIGSGNTGIAATDGDNLAWVLAVVTPALLVVGLSSVFATFILTEDDF